MAHRGRCARRVVRLVPFDHRVVGINQCLNREILVLLIFDGACDVKITILEELALIEAGCT